MPFHFGRRPFLVVLLLRRKYLPLYVAEFQLRYNNRENDDIFGTAIKGCQADVACASDRHRGRCHASCAFSVIFGNQIRVLL